MDIKKSLKNIFNSVVGGLPVIDPHGGLEADLMLAGKKPLTYFPAWPDNRPPPPHSNQYAFGIYEATRKLDEAVRQGKLKSVDVSVTREGETHIARHYCQPDKEKEMMFLAAYNNKVFNDKKPDLTLQKDVGAYLGYRKRDIWLWRHFKYDPSKLSSKLFSFVEKNIARPAHHEKLLHSIEKEQKKADKVQRKNDKGNPKL